MNHTVVLFKNFEGLPYCFRVAAPIYIPTNDTKGFSFSHILGHGCYFHSIIAMKRYPIVVLILISQITSDVEYLHVPVS